MTIRGFVVRCCFLVLVAGLTGCIFGEPVLDEQFEDAPPWGKPVELTFRSEIDPRDLSSGPPPAFSLILTAEDAAILGVDEETSFEFVDIGRDVDPFVAVLHAKNFVPSFMYPVYDLPCLDNVKVRNDETGEVHEIDKQPGCLTLVSGTYLAHGDFWP